MLRAVEVIKHANHEYAIRRPSPQLSSYSSPSSVILRPLCLCLLATILIPLLYLYVHRAESNISSLQHALFAVCGASMEQRSQRWRTSCSVTSGAVVRT